MWSHTIICLLVGFAFASNNPGWKDNTEYVYNIHGRTLTSLHEVSNQYSGILLRAKLRVQSRPDGKLQGHISDAQYGQIHSWLENGWSTDIPEQELSYKPLGMSNSAFQIDMKEGVIRDLIVNKDVPNWEANIIKGVVSQFQLNTKGSRSFYSSGFSSLPEEQQTGNSAAFKTMEETVSGNTETLYDIHPMPEYVLESKPWLARHIQLKGDGQVIEVVKHKNYSNNEELPSYHYGFAEMGDWKPATNQQGKYFTRTSISRAILTGNLNRYTVQNSYTVNEIIMSPTLNNKQKGSVVSVLNVTLEEVKSQGQKIEEVANPVALGNIVYTYDRPFSSSNEARGKQKIQGKHADDSDADSEEEGSQRTTTMNRLRRAFKNYQGDYGYTSGESVEYYQRKPQISAAPESPLLPYTTGYRGMSVKQNKEVNIMETIKKIAKEIGKDLEDPETCLRENTLNKFTIMTSLIRLLNVEELKQVAQSVYTQSQQGPERQAWTAFRDAVAESGTGPAFLTIQDWIESKKMEGEEAAQIVSTVFYSVRQPTLEYIQSFFNFIKNNEVQSQEYLNDTALMSYTNLVRRVYSDKKQSNNQYPGNSFGRFRTSEGKKYIEETVIPYLAEQLHQGVSRGDTHKIHAYIRALGNVGHPRILEAFEPYLEGKKQCSQFQRLLMIAAMDKLVETKPEVARGVLFKVYQNAGETPEVRVAAVFQLMRTCPPTDMLQRMASYTHMDTQEHVSAAVKSSIQTAAKLVGTQFQYLRSSAQAAEPLLIKKDYGVQYGANYLRSYVIQELKLKYKETTQFIGSQDEFFPKGLKYGLREYLGGMRRLYAHVQAMTSSIDELIHVAKLQTESYHQQEQKQEEHAEEQRKQPFSSQNIAHLLNMKGDEREQLEGNLYMEFNNLLQRFISFDNHTIEQWTEVIRKCEEEYKNGKDFHHAKFYNYREMALSFPTEMGLPFLFTYDTPTVFKLKGRVEGAATPQFVSGNKFHQPETIALKTNLEITFNSKIQSRLSFATPFDNQQYISGFDKNFQVHFPLNGNFKVDIKNGQIEAEIEPKESHQDARLFFYSTWPYTSVSDIIDFRPISSQQNTHLIQQKNLHSYENTFGKKETGMAWRVKIEHERHFIDLPRLYGILKDEDLVTGLLNLWDDACIQYSQISVQYLNGECVNDKFVIRMGYQKKYNKEGGNKGSSNQGDLSQYSYISEPLRRQEDIIDKVSSGIKNVEAVVYDGSVEFQGGKQIMYTITGGVGKSNVDPKSRVLIYYRKISESQDVKPYELSLQAKGYIPNTNGLDLTYSLKNEPTIDTKIEVTFGSSQQSPAKIQGQFELRRSEERKRYLQEQPMYQECEREMKKGNYQLPGCAYMMLNSNLLDKWNVLVQHENLRPDVVDTLRTFYDALRFHYYPTLQIKRNEGTGKEGEIKLQAQFDNDLRSVNVSIKAQEEESTIHNIRVGEWAKEILVAHPVFHVRSRVLGRVLGLQTYRPICVVDQTKASTFSNREYLAPLDKFWTVMLHYVPQEARLRDQQMTVEQQLNSQPEQYVVLVRQSAGSKQRKDVKITLNTPATDYKVVDITMNSEQVKGIKGKVFVDGQEVEVNDQQSRDVKDGYIQIYSLPNGEIKVEVRDVFYVIYDGARVKLTALTGKFRNSVRGLCGAFNDDQFHDFVTPDNCITRNYQQFIKSYEVEGDKGKQERQKLSSTPGVCVPKDMPLYANVVSGQDYGREEQSSGLGRPSTHQCTKLQTLYVERNDEICFTIRPVPVCSSQCKQHGTIRKNMQVHCIQMSNVARLWKSQIDKGASPDFSHKRATKDIQMELPQRCSV